MPPVRIGLIGAGTWGRTVLRALYDTPGVAVTALASGRAESRELARPGCAFFSDWHELMVASVADGVVVATPPSSHVDIALRAIAAGLATLVEKPLALSVAEAESLRDEARARSAIVHVNHIDLFNPLWRALHRRLPRIGRVTTLAGAWANCGPFRPDTPSRWDYGAHAVAVAIRAVGQEPTEVSGICRPGVGGGEMFEARLGWPDGANATLTFGNGSDSRQRRITVGGTLGEIVYDDVARVATVNGAPVPHSRQTPLRAAIVRFARAIRCGQPDASDAALGVEVVRTLSRLDRPAAQVR